MKPLFILSVLLLCCSCGTTKVSVNRPVNGTSTTITVTTNNPITTDVTPTTNTNLSNTSN